MKLNRRQCVDNDDHDSDDDDDDDDTNGNVKKLGLIGANEILSTYWESTKSRSYRKQPYWTQHTYCGKY